MQFDVLDIFCKENSIGHQILVGEKIWVAFFEVADARSSQRPTFLQEFFSNGHCGITKHQGCFNGRKRLQDDFKHVGLFVDLNSKGFSILR